MQHILGGYPRVGYQTSLQDEQLGEGGAIICKQKTANQSARDF